MIQPAPPAEPPAGSCDWGDCDAPATTWQYSATHGWLPSCTLCAVIEERRRRRYPAPW